MDILLWIVVVNAGTGIVGTTFQGFRCMDDREEFHRVSLRCSVHSIAMALAIIGLELAK